MMLHYYCLAHERPKFRLDPRIVVVELGAKGASEVSQPNQVVRAYDLVPDLVEDHTWLGGSLGNIAVLRHLQNVGAAPTDRMCMSHYRRFLSPRKHGEDTANEPGICAVSQEDCEGLNPYALVADHPLPFLVSQPWVDGFGANMSIRAQYARAHYEQDLEQYMSLAVDLGYVQRHAIDQFLSGTRFFPGGLEFSMCPVSVYVDVVGKIEALNRAYLALYPPSHRSDYQDRFLCYCNERLGSFFLEEVLRESGFEEEDCLGYMHIVSATEAIEPGKWKPKPKARSKVKKLTGRSCTLHVEFEQTDGSRLQLGLRGYDDGQSVFAGNCFVAGYPNNDELIAGSLEQWEIDVCLDYADREGVSALDARYHDCAWVLHDLRRRSGLHPNRDGIRENLEKWVEDQTSPHVVLSTQNLITSPFAVPHLAAWLETLFDDIKIVAYVCPFETAFAGAISARLTSLQMGALCAYWGRPFTDHYPTQRVFVEACQQAFGQGNVTLVPFRQTDLKGDDILTDFSARVGLDANRIRLPKTKAGLSAEAVSVLAAIAETASPERGSHALFESRMMLHKVLEEFGTRELVPSDALVDEAQSIHQQDAQWLRDILGATESHPEPEDCCIISSKADLLELATSQIDALRQHLQRSVAMTLPRNVKSHEALGQYLNAAMRAGLKSKLKPTLPDGFDPENYLLLNPDLATADIEPSEHFLTLGYFEGRQT